VGQLVAPGCPDDLVVRFDLDTTYPDSRDRTFFMEYTNRIADVETAFNLLHLLQHLNGTAIGLLFRQLSLELINPIALRTLVRHHRAKGSDYRLHVCVYGCWKTYDVKSAATRFLIHRPAAGTATRRSGDEFDDAAFVHVYGLLGGLVNPGTTDLIWEMATTAGLYCRRVEILTTEESEWTTANEHSLMNQMVEVGLFAPNSW
jgi:hypothetical protein